MDIKYLGFADAVHFTKEDFEQAGIKGKDISFGQGEASIQSVTKEVGEYLISEHAPHFKLLTEENRDITNASDTSNVPALVGNAGMTAVATTGDTTTPGDDTAGGTPTT